MASPNKKAGGWRSGQRARGPRSSSASGRRSQASLWETVPHRLKRAFFAAVTLVLAGLIGWLLLPQPPPQSRLMLVGIESYTHGVLPPNGFARQDIETLRALNVEGERSNPFTAVHSPDDSRTSSLIGHIDRQLREKLGGENLVVFCSMHGTLRDDGTAQAEFYGIHAGPDSLHLGEAEQMIEIPKLLAALKATQADNILLLIDAGRLGPNWRMGLLHDDFLAQLQADVERAAIPSLRVICSADNGETSWVSDEWNQSVFGHFLVRGLVGEADGWTESGGNDRQQNKPNNRVSSDELYWYLKHNVGAWAGTHRGVSQTVLSFGQGPSFEVAGTFGRTPPRSGGEPGDSEGGAGDQAQAHVAAGGDTKGASAGGAAADSQKAGDGENQAEAAAQPPSLAELQERLSAAWDRRDGLRSAGEVVNYAPGHWRAVQDHLLLAEKQLRDRLTADAERTLARVDDLFARIAGMKDLAGSAGSGSNRLPPSLALRPLLLPQPNDEQQQQEAERKQALGPLVEAALAAPADDPAAADALKQFLAKTPAAEWDVAETLLERAEGDCRRAELLKLRPLLSVLDVNRWPAELVLLDRLLQAADNWPESAEADWPADRCRQALQLSRLAEELAACDPQLLPVIQGRLGDGMRALLAGERWLLASLAGADVARRDQDRLNEAHNAFEEVEKALADVSDILQLQHELLAELPDYARWMAGRYERTCPTNAALTIPQPLAPQNAEELLDPPGRSLLHLIVEVGRIGQLLEASLKSQGPPSGGDTLRELRDLSTQVKRHRNEFRTEFDRIVKNLIDFPANQRFELEALLDVPWIARRDRQRIEGLLHSGLPARPPQPGLLEPGVWQGFWAIHTLSLGLNAEALQPHWTAWNALVNGLAPGPGGRAQLGKLINGAWRAIAEGANRSASGAESGSRELMVRLIHGLDPLPADEANPVFVHRRRLLGNMLAFRGEEWSQRAQSYDEHRAYELLAARSRDLTPPDSASRSAIRSETSPRFGPLSPPSFGEDRKAALQVRWQRFTAGDGREAGLKLLAFGPDVTIRREGNTVEAAEPVPPGHSAFDYELALHPRAAGPRQVLLALLDARDEFPYDIQRLRLEPPLDPNQWRITFHVEQDGQVKPVDMRGGSELRLPPFGKVELQAYLNRPAGDATPAARVSVFTGPPGMPVEQAAQEDRLIKVAELPEVPLAAEGKPTPLAFERGGNSEAADGEAPAPPAVDLSGGLIFKIRPQGKDEFAHVVRPVFYRSDVFVKQPEARVRSDFTIEIPFERAPVEQAAGIETLIPQQIPIALHLPPALEKLMVEGDLGPEPEFALGQPKTLWARLDVADSLEWSRLAAEGHEITASAAGLPHAFRWQLGANNQLTPKFGKPPLVRIAEPAAWAMIKQGESYKLRIEIDAIELDMAEWDEGRWELEYRLVSEEQAGAGQAGDGLFEPLRVYSSLKKQVLLQALAGGAWELATSAGDYEHERTARQLGRFRLDVRLLRTGRSSRAPEVRAEHSRWLIIDDDRPPPRPVVRARSGPHDLTKPLDLTVEAEDRQSGIRKILLDISEQEKRELDEDGVLRRIDLDPIHPIQDPTRRLPIRILEEELPVEPGRYHMLVQSINGMGVASEVRVFPLELFKPAQAARPQAQTGKLRVVIRDQHGANSVAIDGPKKDQQEVRGLARKEFVFDDLPPGDYTISAQRGGNRSGSGTAKVEAGKITPVEVTLKIGRN